MTNSERQTVEKTIAALLAAGYCLSVNDGEETTIKRSTDPATIIAAMHTTDEDYLLVHAHLNYVENFGWVRFVWGNEDWVAINDHTTNLEVELKPVFDWLEEQELAHSAADVMNLIDSDK